MTTEQQAVLSEGLGATASRQPALVSDGAASVPTLTGFDQAQGVSA